MTPTCFGCSSGFLVHPRRRTITPPYAGKHPAQRSRMPARQPLEMPSRYRFHSTRPAPWKRVSVASSVDRQSKGVVNFRRAVPGWRCHDLVAVAHKLVCRHGNNENRPPSFTTALSSTLLFGPKSIAESFSILVGVRGNLVVERFGQVARELCPFESTRLSEEAKAPGCIYADRNQLEATIKTSIALIP